MVVTICLILMAMVSSNPKPEIAQKRNKLSKRQLDEYGAPAPNVDTYGPPASEPCTIEGPLTAPKLGGNCKPGDQNCKNECVTVEEEVCQQTYEQQCETITDKKCSTVYEVQQNNESKKSIS